jgi:type IV pilus assembly protein PilM
MKIIVANGAFGRISLQHAAMLDFDTGPAKRLRTWVRERELTGCRTVISVPADKAVLRWVMLPNVRGEERREAARFRVKRHLPFPVEEAFIETGEPETEEEGVSASLVIAVRREVIERRVETVAFAGLKPVAAELEAQGVLRVVDRRLQERSLLWRNASLTILDIGNDYTQMYVVQNQRLQFLRSVRFGVSHIVEALAAALEISNEEADARLALPGTTIRQDGRLVIDTAHETAVVDLSGVLERLTRECLRLLRYFRSLHPERSYAGILDHMVLSGGAAGVRGLAEFLSTFLKLRVEPVRPFAGLAANIEGDAFRKLAMGQEAYTVALGLALCGLDKAAIEYRKEGHEAKFVWQRCA